MSKQEMLIRWVDTKRLIIDPLRKEDKNFFLELVEDYVVKRYFSYGENKSECENFFEDNILRNEDPRRLYLVIRKKNDYCPIGMINAFYYSNNVWILEIAILDQFRRNHYAEEVISFAIEHSEELLRTFCEYQKGSASEFMLEIAYDNEASRNLFKKVARMHNKYFEIGKTCYIKL